MEEDGFQLVKKGNNKRFKNNNNSNLKATPESNFKFTYMQTKGGEGSSKDSHSISSTVQKIQHVMDDLKKDTFFVDTVNIMRNYVHFENLSGEFFDGMQSTSLTDRNPTQTTQTTQTTQSPTSTTHFHPLHIQEIVCYGIGNFSFSKKSLHQLCFILLVSQQLCVTGLRVLLFDPVFTEIEKQVLTKLGCVLILENEEGKRKITSSISHDSNDAILDAEKIASKEEGVLFYMPHCGKQLYNNLLWSNWDQNTLKKMVIFGNSFTNYCLRDTKSSSCDNSNNNDSVVSGSNNNNNNNSNNSNNLEQPKQFSDKKFRKKNKRKVTEGIISHLHDKKSSSQPQHHTVNYIDRISQHTLEIAIPQNYFLGDIFNDQSLHFFPIQQELDKVFWSFNPEPFSSITDSEIITKDTKLCC